MENKMEEAGKVTMERVGEAVGECEERCSDELFKP